MTESDISLKELEKARYEKKGLLPTVEADSILDNFTFTPYDIQAPWLLVKDIVDKWSYKTDSVKADWFRHLFKMSCNIISFYARHVIIT